MRAPARCGSAGTARGRRAPRCRTRCSGSPRETRPGTRRGPARFQRGATRTRNSAVAEAQRHGEEQRDDRRDRRAVDDGQRAERGRHRLHHDLAVLDHDLAGGVEPGPLELVGPPLATTRGTPGRTSARSARGVTSTPTSAASMHDHAARATAACEQSTRAEASAAANRRAPCAALRRVVLRTVICMARRGFTPETRRRGRTEEHSESESVSLPNSPLRRSGVRASAASTRDFSGLALEGQGLQRGLDLASARRRERGVVQLAGQLLAVVRRPPEEVARGLRLLRGSSRCSGPCRR